MPLNFLITFSAFLSGFIILSLEMMGFRVLAPHFGYSTYVFGSLIGLILLAMSVGYSWGGLLSRRNVAPKRFFLILFISSIYLALSSSLYEPLLQLLRNLDIFSGTLLATFILWAFPMATLAAVSPYLVGIMSQGNHPGYSSGFLSTVSTLGALLGTFFTSFYFLPHLGTSATFKLNVFLTIIISVFWLVPFNKKWLLAIAFTPIVIYSIPDLPLPDYVLHREESVYSQLEVVSFGELIGLRTESRSGTIYSAVMKNGSMPDILLHQLFAVPVALNDAKTGLLLGLGAGTLPQIHQHLNPELLFTGVELDSKVISIAKEFFGLNDLKNIKEINIYDARPFLYKDANKYDVIEMDIFREIEIPFYLVSREFFTLTKEHLNLNGIFLMNVYDPTPSNAIKDSISNTLSSVYPVTYVVPAGHGSFLMVGSNNELNFDNKFFKDQRLVYLANYFSNNMEMIFFSPDKTVFTDDLAPIELLVNL